MSTFDYAELIGVAQDLLAEFGRAVKLLGYTGQTPTDTNKPWKSPTGAPDELELDAAFVPPNTVRQFGLTALGEGTDFSDLVAKSEQIAIVSPGAQVDLRNYTVLIDIRQINTWTVHQNRWGIIGLQVLRPGDDVVLGFLGVRR